MFSSETLNVFTFCPTSFMYDSTALVATLFPRNARVSLSGKQHKTRTCFSAGIRLLKETDQLLLLSVKPPLITFHC